MQLEFDFFAPSGPEKTAAIEAARSHTIRLDRISAMVANPNAPVGVISRAIACEIANLCKLMRPFPFPAAALKLSDCLESPREIRLRVGTILSCLFAISIRKPLRDSPPETAFQLELRRASVVELIANGLHPMLNERPMRVPVTPLARPVEGPTRRLNTKPVHVIDYNLPLSERIRRYKKAVTPQQLAEG
jgi:hypothetical protein